MLSALPSRSLQLSVHVYGGVVGPSTSWLLCHSDKVCTISITTTLRVVVIKIPSDAPKIRICTVSSSVSCEWLRVRGGHMCLLCVSCVSCVSSVDVTHRGQLMLLLLQLAKSAVFSKAKPCTDITLSITILFIKEPECWYSIRSIKVTKYYFILRGVVCCFHKNIKI